MNKHARLPCKVLKTVPRPSLTQPRSHQRLLEVPHPLAHVQLRVPLEHAQLGLKAHGAQLVDDLVWPARCGGGVGRQGGGARAVREVVQDPEGGDTQRDDTRLLRGR